MDWGSLIIDDDKEAEIIDVDVSSKFEVIVLLTAVGDGVGAGREV